MNETSTIRPWQPAPSTKIVARPAVVVPTEADERLLLARLFGKTPAPATSTDTARPRAASNDDFAPHLGRHLDVIA